MIKVFSKTCLVSFIDYGNSEELEFNRLRSISSEDSTQFLKEQAIEIKLFAISMVEPERDPDMMAETIEAIQTWVNKSNGESLLAVYRNGEVILGNGIETLQSYLITRGLAWIPTLYKKMKNKPSPLSSWIDEEQIAMKKRLNLWRYGDFTADDE